MTDLNNLASRITDHSNTIAQAEQAIVATLREMHNAGAQIVTYVDTEEAMTVVVFPTGADTCDIDNAVLTVELPTTYMEDLATFTELGNEA